MGIDLSFGQDDPGENKTFDLLEDGIYTLRLEAMEYKEGAKAPYFNCTFSVAPEHKRLVWSILTLSDKTFPREQLQAFLETLTGREWRGNQTIEVNDLVGLLINGVITTEIYFSDKKNKDVEKNKIDAFLPAEDVSENYQGVALPEFSDANPPF